MARILDLEGKSSSRKWSEGPGEDKENMQRGHWMWQQGRQGTAVKAVDAGGKAGVEGGRRSPKAVYLGGSGRGKGRNGGVTR